MVKLPGDELGRAWLKGEFPQGAARTMERGLLTLVTPFEGKVQAIGNAFIISAQQTSAVCLTAAHNFEEIKKLRSARQLRAHSTMPPDFRPRFSYIHVDQAAAFYLHDDRPIPCRIGQVAYHEGYDVATFTVHAPDDLQIFERHLAIDLSIPEIGEEVVIFGHKLGIEHQGENQGLLSREPQLLRGVVSAMAFGKGRMLQSCNFETSIPIEPGISGSPVLRLRDIEAGQLIACGIASFDFSEPASFQDFLVPGLSSCAMLWPVMGSGGINGSMFGGPEQFRLLNELRRSGAFDDRTPKDIELVVEPSTGEVEVGYCDRRTSTTYIYAMKPHPAAYSPEAGQPAL